MARKAKARKAQRRRQKTQRQKQRQNRKKRQGQKKPQMPRPSNLAFVERYRAQEGQMREKGYISPNAAVQMTGCSITTIYRLIRNGDVRSMTTRQGCSRRFWIKKTSLKRLLA